MSSPQLVLEELDAIKDCMEQCCTFQKPNAIPFEFPTLPKHNVSDLNGMTVNTSPCAPGRHRDVFEGRFEQDNHHRESVAVAQKSGCTNGKISQSTPFDLPFLPKRKMSDLTGMVVKTSDFPFASGGQSDVFEGRLERDKGHCERVAIKVLRSSSKPSGSSQHKQKLLREAKVCTGLTHPNIAPFYGLCYNLGPPGIPCFITPYYTNGNVHDYLETHPREDRLQLVCQVAAGIAYLHSEQIQIVHGDIKAANVFINENKEACIGDFGVSRVVGYHGFTTHHASFRWLPPELISDVTTTTANDVWAFAMTVIEIFTGCLPFYKIQLETAVLIHISLGGRPLREDYLEIDDSIWSVLEPCWERDYTRRPPIHHLSKELNVIAARQSNETLVPVMDTFLGMGRRNPTRRKGRDSSSTSAFASILDTPHARTRSLSFSKDSSCPAKADPAPYPCRFGECPAQFGTLKECQAHQLRYILLDADRSQVSDKSTEHFRL